MNDKYIAHDFARRVEDRLNLRLSDDQFHQLRTLLLKVFRLGAELNGQS